MSWDSLSEDILEEFSNHTGGLAYSERVGYSTFKRSTRRPKTRDEINAAVRLRRKTDPGFAARRRAAALRWLAKNPDFQKTNRQRVNALKRERYASDPEYRERVAEQIKARRDAINARRRARYASDPEYRAQREQQKARYAAKKAAKK